MNRFKSYSMIVTIVVIIIIIHFLMVVYQPIDYKYNNQELNANKNEALFNTREFSAESLSDLFGMDYSKFIKSDDEFIDNDSTEASQILLNDVQVTIRAISTKNDQTIVYVFYQQDGKDFRDKIAIKGELFGYVLSNVENGILTFNRGEEILKFMIFKTQKHDEGKL